MILVFMYKNPNIFVAVFFVKIEMLYNIIQNESSLKNAKSNKKSSKQLKKMKVWFSLFFVQNY